MISTLAFIEGQQGLLVLVVLVLLFGGKKLPELARGMGQAIREFNKAKNETTEITEVSNNKPLPPV
jgi:sec-independent protein translocase protein TatA